ncbi:raffinose/stachyose/melibiose transport system substrate-binding protein [Paenibacillus rhizosphaerae]|uniref:Raffinose/stachyose/melibiose transport system substrate-binding protein n=1 Tax=Paenibacillus rhizosphaerae TaxID=297318 RepID=A0A839TP96_9BACL|nr:extracellular solute-binding protein [Paenibacillus rhizosphaerae]MBB3128522.1 raffinose/stachyose/melibiose transport system substrate-binding protein [Paenibacillus rhizosphaerae]
MMKPALRTFGKMMTVVGLVSMLVLAGCSSNDGGAASGKIRLQVPDAAIWGEESSALQVMYDKFSADHPDVKLEQVTMADDQAMSAALAAGKAPDLMLMDPSLAKERFKSGYVEPLDKYYDQYGWGHDMFGWAKNAYVEGGKTIGVPWNYEGLILVYNGTMFKENGWAVPKNYGELLSLVPEIKEKGIMPFAWGSSDNPGVDDWWVTSIVNSILGKEGTKQLYSGDVKWNDPAIVDGIKRYDEFWNAGYVTDKKSQAISQEDSSQLFLNSKAAMRLDGTWSLAADNEPDFDIGFAPFPSWKQDGEPIIPLGVGGGLVINAKSEHKDEVAELLNYFFNPDVVKTMAEHGIPEPIQMDYAQFDLKPNVAKALNLISEAEKTGRTGYVAWSYGPPSVVQVLESDFASVYLKKTTPEAWLDNLQKLKEKDFADNRIFGLDKY